MVTLAVDGDPGDLGIISDILLKIDPDGNHIKAGNGKKAMEAVKQYPPDVVFLDTALPDTDGIDIAEKILMRQVETNIVFITDDPSCAMRAFEIYASGYLLKPVTEEDIRRAMMKLRYPLKQGEEGSRKLEVRCFGTFEVFANGKPISFGRSKTKQLLAYLIDRQGDICDIPQMVCALWPESDGGPTVTNYLRRLISDLRTVLDIHGIGEAIIRSRGRIGINKEMVDCDYYDYLSGDPEAFSGFKGEYMSQYSLGEMTLASLIMEREEGYHMKTLPVRENRLEVKCFGNFEVLYMNEPLLFRRRKSRELFAFLIDRQGAACTTEEAARALWGEGADIDASRRSIRTALWELKKSLNSVGMEDVIIRKHQQLALKREKVDCDYWRYMNGESRKGQLWPESYMPEYAWAEFSRKRIASENVNKL